MSNHNLGSSLMFLDSLIDFITNLTVNNYILIIAVIVFIITVAITAYIKFKHLKNDT